MYQVKLTASSVVRSVPVTNEVECATLCMEDDDLCLAFDVYYLALNSYRCDLAGSNPQFEDTDDFMTVHFRIEKFPRE